MQKGIPLEKLRQGGIRLEWGPSAWGSIPPDPGMTWERGLESPTVQDFPLYFHKTSLVTELPYTEDRWPWFDQLEETEAVQIHPKTAWALGVENGEALILSSPFTTREGRAWITRTVPPGMVSFPKDLGGDRVRVQKKDQADPEALERLKRQGDALITAFE